jgi:hypothetical protein
MTEPRAEAAAPKAAAPPQGEAPPERPKAEGSTIIFVLKRWVLWFLAFFGIYASSSMCPFCGAPGCPVGAGGAALVGGVFASLWQYGANVFRKCKEVAQRFLR